MKVEGVFSSSYALRGESVNVSFHNQGVWDKRQEAPVKTWPLAMIGNTSRGEESLDPLAVDYSFFQRPSNAYLVEEVWDGENLNLEIVFKWVASKLKSIVRCIGVAFSGYEMEPIQLLSRIEKSIVLAKTSGRDLCLLQED